MANRSERGRARITEDAAAAEVARHYLDCYGAFVHQLKPAAHHKQWCERITEVVDPPPLREGEARSRKRKLLIIAPPGHAKSTWVSQITPTWYLGRHPDHHVLFVTSADHMARRFSGTVKLTLESNERHALAFPDPTCRPNFDRGWSSMGLYLQGCPDTDKDPTYVAAGYNASVIGARAHGLILDDLLTQEQSTSEVEQAKAKDYADMTLDLRLDPNIGWALAVMTRWNESDLASHLMASEEWDVVNMPALTGGDTGYPVYPWGEALWPQRFSKEWLLAKRTSMNGGPAMFECAFQGDPTSMGGNIFTGTFAPLPVGFESPGPNGEKSRAARLTRVQFWDLNFSSRETADFTAGVTLAIDPKEDRLFVLNVHRDQMDERLHEEFLFQAVRADKPALVGIWKGVNKAATVSTLVSGLRRRLIGTHACAFLPVDETKDKITRARLPAGYLAGGRLHVRKDAPWFAAFEAELRGFPNRAHDDQVDALSGAVQLAIENAYYQQTTGSTSYAFGAEPKPRGRFDL